MRDRWLEEHVGNEAMVRPEFESSLGETLQSAWRSPGGSVSFDSVSFDSVSPGRVSAGPVSPGPVSAGPVSPGRPSGPSRRTQVLIWAAAAAVLLVSGAVVLTQSGKSTVTSNTDDVTLPVTALPTFIAVTTVPPATIESDTDPAATTPLPPTTLAPAVVATSPEQQTVLDYLTALADERYDDAAKLLGEGGLSLEDRSDLRPFLNADGQIPDLAASLGAWCQQALCQLPTSISNENSRVAASFTANGVKRTTMFVAATFEGSPMVRGLPLQLPTGASLADTVECPTGPVDDTAYADLDGDGWYETVALLKEPGVGFLLFACATTLDIRVFTSPLTEDTAVGLARLLPLDIEDDGTDEILLAAFFPDGFYGPIVRLRSEGLAAVGHPVRVSFVERASFGCDDADRDGIRDLVSYSYELVGGAGISNSTALDFVATPIRPDGTDGPSVSGSLALPAQEVEAFRLISGYCGNFPTQTG